MGVILYKDSKYQTGRSTSITIAGAIDFRSGYAIYVTATDRSDRQAALVRVSDLASGNLRLSRQGIAALTVNGGSIGSIEDDDPGQSQRVRVFQFNNVELRGGFVRSTLANLRFAGCTFTGSYTMFPPATNIELVNSSAKSNIRIPEYIRQSANLIE